MIKISRLLDARKAFILKQGPKGLPMRRTSAAGAARQASYFNWRKKYDGKLRKLLADLSLDREMPQDVIRRKW